ncbi:MAG: type II toxin-antitoxin system RelE/ParE family toxin [Pirellulales bacterium]
MIVLVSRDAENDIVNAIAFYDSSGLNVGNYFLLSIMADLESLSLFGGIHSKRFGYHSMAAKRFPFPIYDSLIDDTVYVIAILDERRDPALINRRLGRG